MNTPIPEIPYRTAMVMENGEEFECVVVKKEGNDLHIVIDDEKAGKQNGARIVLGAIQ